MDNYYPIDSLYLEGEWLEHYGTKYHSGRYPYGSGENPYQHDPRSFLQRYKALQDEGMSEKNIAKALLGPDATTTSLRNYRSHYSEVVKQNNINRAKDMYDNGAGYTEIGKTLGVNESTVRGWVNQGVKRDVSKNAEIAEFLAEQCNETGFLDIGTGSERWLDGVSQDRLKKSVDYLKSVGYKVETVHIDQVGAAGKQTNVKVLVHPDAIQDYSKYENSYDAAVKAVKAAKVKTLADYTTDDSGKTFRKLERPASLDSSRVMVRYNISDDIHDPNNGLGKDGTMEIRPGCVDLDLGNSAYAQVRIKVDDTHYLKGMAIYGDPKDFPKGVDVIFNTNKTSDVPMMGPKDDTVLKVLKSDPDNQFGANIKAGGQYFYTDPKTGKEKLSPINKINDEGDWGEWSKTLSAQFLSKQDIKLIEKQLGLARDEKKSEFDEIKSLTNGTLKVKLLEEFADECDSAAVHLKGAALPRQQSHVLIPIPEMKDNEIYAPNFKNGEKVVLVRYPHGSISEIPELIVNNRVKAAQNVIGTNSRDAVGINSNVAMRLSGADFDGDTALVIPNNKGEILHRDTFEALKGFDTSDYAYARGEKHIRVGDGDGFVKGLQMGEVTNLITDMTLLGAGEDEIAKALKHSMVIIDAEKHDLNWKKSELDNDIRALKEKYQGKPTGGASTIVSRSTSPVYVNNYKLGETRVLKDEKGNVIYNEDGAPKTKVFYWDPDTGKKLKTETGEYSVELPIKNLKTGKKVLADIKTDIKTGKQYLNYFDPNKGEWVKDYNIDQGKKKYKQKVSTKMFETEDAYSLVGTPNEPKEIAYAEHANYLKNLGNQARAEISRTKTQQYNKEAAKKYKASGEIASLNVKLNDALKNAPLERQAQILANNYVSEFKRSHPDADKDDYKKAKTKALNEARATTGAKKHQIYITDSEWKAIQAGAISNNKLEQILNNADEDRVKELATPRRDSGALSAAQIASVIQMAHNGYTNAEIAEGLGVSASTISKLINESK